jgi:hypothetical protein
MASRIGSKLTTPAHTPIGRGNRLEQEANGEPQTRTRCVPLFDAELEQVAAAGGGIRVDSGGANN